VNSLADVVSKRPVPKPKVENDIDPGLRHLRLDVVESNKQAFKRLCVHFVCGFVCK
jgi:hypothetical protein